MFSLNSFTKECLNILYKNGQTSISNFIDFIIESIKKGIDRNSLIYQMLNNFIALKSKRQDNFDSFIKSIPKDTVSDFLMEAPIIMRIIVFVLNNLAMDRMQIIFSIFISLSAIIVYTLKLFKYFMINKKIRYSLTFFIIALDVLYEICYGNSLSFFFIPTKFFAYIFSFLPLTSCWARWFYSIYAVPNTEKMINEYNTVDPEMQKPLHYQEVSHKN